MYQSLDDIDHHTLNKLMDDVKIQKQDEGDNNPDPKN